MATTDIRTIDHLLPFAGTVIKYSRDERQTWTFAKLWKAPEYFGRGRTFAHSKNKSDYFGLATYEQVSSQGLHARLMITRRDLASGRFVVQAAEPQEYEGVEFSYQFSHK